MAPQDRSLQLIKKLASEDTAQGAVICDVVLARSYADFLVEAPLAICGMGHCYIAAGVPRAALIDIHGTGLEYTSVRANLVQCADMGRAAFSEASSQMHRIQLAAQHICQPNGLVSLPRLDPSINHYRQIDHVPTVS
jgi:hypothetical protein